MLIRIISGIALAAAALAVVFAAPLWASAVLLAAVSAAGVVELWKAAGGSGKGLLPPVSGAILAALLPLWSYLGGSFAAASLGVALCSILIFSSAVTGASTQSENAGNTKTPSAEALLACLFGAAVLPMLFISLLRIITAENGRYLVVFPLGGALLSDTFALFGGKLFGKNKLCPELSPNKTVEGSITGLIAAPLLLLCYALALSLIGFKINLAAALLAGFVAAAAGQMGDLAFSYLKRRFGVKDYGRLIPGHGGVLDRLDSVLFAAPAAELAMLLVPIILR